MMKNKKDAHKQQIGGVFLAYTTEFIEIATGLIYTPFMLRMLGQSEYGLYQLVASVVSYLSLIGLGFSSSYQRFYAKTKQSGDEKAIERMNGLFMLIYLIMSAICIIAGTFMVANADILFMHNLTTTEIEKSQILLVIMIFNMALTFPESLFTSYIISQRKFIVQKVILLCRKTLNPFLCLIVLLLGYGSVGLVVVALFLAVLSFSANAITCVKKLGFRLTFRKMDFSQFKEMWWFTFFIFLNQIVNQINWNVDKYLLGSMCGTAAVAIYSIGGQLRNYYSMFSSSISNVFVPQVNELVAKGEDKQKLTNIFVSVGKIQSFFVFLVLTGFFLFGKSFILLWAGEGYVDSYYIALMLFLVLAIPYVENIGVEIQRAMNKHKIRSIVYLAMSILNVGISIPLIKSFGAIGAALGTVISVFLCNVIFMNIYYSVYIGIKMKQFWVSILRVAPSIVLSTLVGQVILSILKPDTWLRLICSIVIYCMIYTAMLYAIGISKETRNKVNNKVVQFLWKTQKT